ncbi:hypothetical protein GCM10027168_59520 [Streptomyces capparidis]
MRASDDTCHLAPPEAMWTAGAVVAALAAGGVDLLPDCAVDGDGIACDDGGGNWWRLARVAGGRAVAIGNDHEYSDTSAGDHDPPLDLLAGAPAWFPHAWFVRVATARTGFVYWWEGEDGPWRRTAYPEAVGDDGHRNVCTLATADDIAEVALYARGRDDEAAGRALAELAARAWAREVDEAVLAVAGEALVPGGFDAAGALRVAVRAGLTPHGGPPRVAAHPGAGVTGSR